MESPKPAAPAPKQEKSSDASEEKDYGLGIGDILGSEDEIDPSKVGENDDLGPTVDAKAASRRSIESILNRGKAPARPRPRPAAQPLAPAGYVPRKGLSKTAILLIVVVLLFAAAAGGIYMFVRKNGVSNATFAGLFGKAKAPAAAVNAPAEPAAPQSVNVTVLVSANPPKEGGPQSVTTRVIETDVKMTDSFPATGEGKATSGTSAARSTGKATIINDTAKSYTFVATTRLLSKEGVLFRMKSQSPIPAKGSVTVDVYADQPGAAGDIGPTTFTIPGLPPALQKDIYAKSDAAMTGGAAKAGTRGKAVTQADIDAAKKALTDRLKKEADGNFAVIIQDGEKLLPELETSAELSATAPKVGTAGDKFTLTLSVRFRALVVPEKTLLPLLQKAMTDSLPPGTAGYSLGTPIYTVQAFPSPEEAQLRAEAPVIKK